MKKFLLIMPLLFCGIAGEINATQQQTTQEPTLTQLLGSGSTLDDHCIEKAYNGTESFLTLIQVYTKILKQNEESAMRLIEQRSASYEDLYLSLKEYVLPFLPSPSDFREGTETNLENLPKLLPMIRLGLNRVLLKWEKNQKNPFPYYHLIRELFNTGISIFSLEIDENLGTRKEFLLDLAKVYAFCSFYRNLNDKYNNDRIMHVDCPITTDQIIAYKKIKSVMDEVGKCEKASEMDQVLSISSHAQLIANIARLFGENDFSNNSDSFGSQTAVMFQGLLEQNVEEARVEFKHRLGITLNWFEMIFNLFNVKYLQELPLKHSVNFEKSKTFRDLIFGDGIYSDGVLDIHKGDALNREGTSLKWSNVDRILEVLKERESRDPELKEIFLSHFSKDGILSDVNSAVYWSKIFRLGMYGDLTRGLQSDIPLNKEKELQTLIKFYVFHALTDLNKDLSVLMEKYTTTEEKEGDTTGISKSIVQTIKTSRDNAMQVTKEIQGLLKYYYKDDDDLNTIFCENIKPMWDLISFLDQDDQKVNNNITLPDFLGELGKKKQELKKELIDNSPYMLKKAEEKAKAAAENEHSDMPTQTTSETPESQASGQTEAKPEEYKPALSMSGPHGAEQYYDPNETRDIDELDINNDDLEAPTLKIYK